MQRRLLQPRSQTRRCGFLGQGWCGQRSPSFVRIYARGLTSLASVSSQHRSPCLWTCPTFMHVSARSIFLMFTPTLTATPFSFVRVNARGVDLPRVRVDIHSPPPPPPFPAPRLCTLTYEGSTMFAPAFTTGFPRVYTPTHEGLFPLCLHRCSQLRPPLQSQVRFGPISRLLGSVHPDG